MIALPPSPSASMRPELMAAGGWLRVESGKGLAVGISTAKAGKGRNSDSSKTICLCQSADLYGKVKACKQQRK